MGWDKKRALSAKNRVFYETIARSVPELIERDTNGQRISENV